MEKSISDLKTSISSLKTSISRIERRSVRTEVRTFNKDAYKRNQRAINEGDKRAKIIMPMNDKGTQTTALNHTSLD